MFLLLITSIMPIISPLPMEYKGWINNCSLYFEHTTTTTPLDSSFVECHTHVCQATYLLNCDKYQLVKNYSLQACMGLCCSEGSQYRLFQSVLDFLSQCQSDFLDRKNKQLVDINRLPFIVLGYTFLGITLLLCICLAIAYWDEINMWARQQLTNRNGNDAGIQMRNMLN